MVGPQFLYPKLAMWNKVSIFDDKCFGWQLGMQSRRNKELCKTIKTVGWVHYADGYLYSGTLAFIFGPIYGPIPAHGCIQRMHATDVFNG
jgi:hypothetical protein